MSDVESRLTALESRVGELEDINAIRRLHRGGKCRETVQGPAYNPAFGLETPVHLLDRRILGADSRGHLYSGRLRSSKMEILAANSFYSPTWSWISNRFSVGFMMGK